MAYDNLRNDGQPILRDYLAAERTHLANERTLLAYIRTALIIFVAALTFAKLFEGDLMMRTISLALSPLGLAVGAIGVWRFRKTRRKLAAFGKMPR
jgi:putative membrane protein